ncbi:MAG: BREX-2 system phosphatase PglZ [Rhodopirellula sp.]|nr:BREX-2 system phosphatase PglZ [Rhodopirellula sp.]
MTTTAPTFSQIKAQIAAVRRKIPHARTIAIRTPERWAGEQHYQDGGEQFAIYQCDSPLAMRIALRERNDDDVTKVLVTPLEDLEVGQDILMRLQPRKIVSLDGWQIVKALFQARSIDPRLTQHRWIADRLIEQVPPEGFAPVPGGFLDAETAWPILLGRMIGLKTPSPDLVSLLKWSLNDDNVARFCALDAQFQSVASEWLEGLAGPAASVILKCLRSLKRPDAVPVGIAAGVVFHSSAGGELQKAAGKFEERCFGGLSLPEHVIATWHAAATEVVRTGLTDTRSREQIVARADGFLENVGASTHAWLSDTSRLGFEQRMATFGQRLEEVLSTSVDHIPDMLTSAHEAVLAHDRSQREQRRIERLNMAVRLVRWLCSRQKSGAGISSTSLADAASEYLQDGGYVDWARLSLQGAEPERQLSTAYTRLFEAVTAICEEKSQSFANLLTDWTRAAKNDQSIVPVEEILDRIVAPIAASQPVLVIVLDGMSVAVFRELMADILGHEWALLAASQSGMQPGLATIPSLTEVSRSSLLCGRLAQGNQTTERNGFAEHPALFATCRAKNPPVLFHKAALMDADDASLAADIRDAISSSHKKVVGVVVNAIDDHLSKGDQLGTRWTRDEIKVLPVLLHEARLARRTVILLSDHGHVLDSGTTQPLNAGSHRWRSADDEPQSSEIRITGPRVQIPASSGLDSSGRSVIVPWSEKLRYASKSNGYHGGVNLQEMVVPIAVLSASDEYPEGWDEALTNDPDWWNEELAAVDIGEPPPVLRKPVRKKPPGRLFAIDDVDEPDASQEAAATVAKDGESAPAADWIVALLESSVFAEQKRFAGRSVPQDEVFVQLLKSLSARGGKLTTSALCKVMNWPRMRLPGLLAVVQRVLNVDGYDVLKRDDTSDTVELDRDLLRRQFDVDQEQA